MSLAAHARVTRDSRPTRAQPNCHFSHLPGLLTRNKLVNVGPFYWATVPTCNQTGSDIPTRDGPGTTVTRSRSRCVSDTKSSAQTPPACKDLHPLLIRRSLPPPCSQHERTGPPDNMANARMAFEATAHRGDHRPCCSCACCACLPRISCTFPCAVMYL